MSLSAVTESVTASHQACLIYGDSLLRKLHGSEQQGVHHLTAGHKEAVPEQPEQLVGGFRLASHPARLFWVSDKLNCYNTT